MSESATTLPLITVFSSTGSQGKSAIDALYNSYRIRALTRNTESNRAKSLKSKYPQIELFAIDFSKDESLVSALKGSCGVYLVVAPAVGSYTVEKSISDASKVVNLIYDRCNELGCIKHIIFGSSVGSGENTGVGDIDNKYPIEKLLISRNKQSLLNNGILGPKYINILRYGYFFDNFVKYPEVSPKDGILPVYWDIDVKVPFIGTIDFGKIIKVLLDNSDKYSSNKINDDYKLDDYVLDVVEGYYTFEEIANTLNKILGFGKDKEIIAQNARKQFPFGAFEGILRTLSKDVDDVMPLFEFFGAGWKSNKNTIQAKDILKENKVEMQSLDDFIKKEMNSDACKAKYCKKQTGLLSFGNVATLTIAGSIGYGAYWYYKHKYNVN